MNVSPWWQAILTSAVLLTLTGTCPSQELPKSGVYQIISGAYVLCCGPLGPVTNSLPNPQQHYVRLNTDQINRMGITVLGDDLKTIFAQEVCTLADRFFEFDFDYGIFTSGTLLWSAGPTPPPNFHVWSYTVQATADQIRINGVGGPSNCSVNRLSLIDVVALLVPPVTVRSSEVEVCWTAETNRTYQVQYRPSFPGDTWTNLGDPVEMKTSPHCIVDKTPAGEPSRFYRVVLIP